MDLRRRSFGRVSVSENGKSAAPQVEITQDVISKAELSDAVEALASEYHDEFAAGGRKHRLLVVLHPSITRPRAEDDNPTPTSGGHTTPKET